jgi:hypothetical protein
MIAVYNDVADEVVISLAAATVAGQLPPSGDGIWSPTGLLLSDTSAFFFLAVTSSSAAVITAAFLAEQRMP